MPLLESAEMLAAERGYLQDAAVLALKAIDARDKKELFAKLGDVDKACESCHLHYWYPNDARAVQAAKETGVLD